MSVCLKGRSEENVGCVFSLVDIHGGLVTFGSVGVGFETAFPPSSQGVLLLLVQWAILLSSGGWIIDY